MLKIYHGRCHCGGVELTAEFDLDAGTEKCNCTYCRRVRLWSVRTAPEQVSVTNGRELLTDYCVRMPNVHHFFCSRCGVHMYDRIDPPNMQNASYCNVNLACLDDLTVEDWVMAPMSIVDGLHDHWEQTPDEARHL